MKPFDANGAFLPAVNADAGGLRRRAVRGAGITVIAQSLAFAVQMVAAIFLARLLMPADFGVVAMVTTFSLFLAYVGQIGFPEAVMQREELNQSLASNLFWINMAIGLALTLGFAATGPWLAKFYGDPRVAHITAPVSLTIFLTCTSCLHLALLQRAMRFSAISINDILSRTISVALSVAMAWAGFGYWALVGGAVAQPLALSIGVWILCRWTPSLPRRTDGTGAMVRFATDVYGRFSVDYVTHNLDNLLVGWRFGSLSLGFYKKAYELFVLPANQFLSSYPVAVSTLSRLTKDRAQYRRYLLGGISVLAFAAMGIAVDLTVIGKDLIRLLLGPQWGEAGRIFTFFGPGLGIMMIYRTQGMIHLSLGTTARYVRWAVVEFVVTALLFVLGLHWGPLGIATAWTVSSWVLIFPAFWYAGRPIDFGFLPVLGAIWRYFVASLLAGVGCVLTVAQIPSVANMPGPVGAFTRIVVDCFLLAFFYISGVVLLHGGYDPLYQIAGLLREMLPGRKSKQEKSSSRVVISYKSEPGGMPAQEVTEETT